MKLVYLVSIGLVILSGCSGSSENKTTFSIPDSESKEKTILKNGNESSNTKNLAELQEKAELVKAVQNGMISYSTNGTEQELIEALESVKSALREKDQHFQLDCSKDTTFVGDNGTTISIKAGSFLLPNGTKAIGKIDFTLLECYDLLSFFTNNLSTQTVSNRILETAGSVKIEASKKGLPLSLNKSQPIVIAFPIPNYQRSKNATMSTFYADSKTATIVKWDDNENKTTNSSSVDNSKISDRTVTESHVYMVSSEADLVNSRLQGSGTSLKDWMKEHDLKAQILRKFAENQNIATLQMTLRKDGSIKEITGTNIIEQDLKDALYVWLKKAPNLNMSQLKPNIPYSFTIKGTQIIRNKGMENFISNGLDEDGYLNKNIDSKALGKYLLSVTQLGWINCDRYFGQNSMLYTLSVPFEENTEYFLVCEENYMVFRPIDKGKGLLAFELIPGDYDYRLFAIKNSEKGLFYNEKVIKVNKHLTEALIASIAIKLADLKKRLWFRD